MAYIVFKSTGFLNEDDHSGMTAAALKQAGISSVEGFGGETIPVNDNGFLVNPAQHLPSGMLDKLKSAWSSSNGDVQSFYNQSVDGQSVKDILSQCPSQQSFGIAKELNLPDGTNVPCKEFTDKGYSAIKYNSASSSNGGSSSDAAASPASPSSGSDSASGNGSSDGAGNSDASGNDTAGDAAVGADAGNEWWSFFGSKEFLIGAVAVGGVLAVIKALGNTIKVRFRKCAKVLYRMQKDFGTKESGMDMKAVLPGVGSKITDWISRLWGGKTGKGKNKGALGLRPFVDNYKNEISGDLAESKKAFNLIRGAADSQTSGSMNNLAKPKQPNESLSENSKVYESFAEALNDGELNESEAINELALGTAIAAGSLALSAIKLAAGAFKFTSKDKNGKDVEKEVKVTPKSVREICYSILNVFYGKYFDLERVFKALGITDLSEVDKSNVDKFAKVVKKSSEEIPAGGKSKMFARVEKNYNSMVDSYMRIGNTVVNNFEKFTKKSKGLDGKEKELSEKDSNLLVAATEKLKAELKRQEDGYKNNFARVMNAIISSPEYAEFTTFILEKVLPVFKSGLASDADYVLDIVPKVGEYYIVRQTGNQPGLNSADIAEGNVVLVRVKNFDQSGENSKNPKITFARVAILKNPGELWRNDKMEYDMTGYKEENLDRTAFSKARGDNADVSGQSGDAVTLEYSKWLALDPTVALNVPGDDRDSTDLSMTKLYKRTINDRTDEYVFGISTKVKEDAAESFDEAQNISEADGKAEVTRETNDQPSSSEITLEDPQSDIIKLAVMSVDKDADIFGDPKQIHLTCSYINLGAKCSAKQVDEKLRSLQFVPMDNKIKEKEHIVNSIANNIGYTHVSKINANDINSIDDSLKQLETRQTTSESLIANIDTIANNLYQAMDSMKNVSVNTLTHPFGFQGFGQRSFVTLPKETGKNGYYKELPTGVKDKRGLEIVFNYYPALISEDGNPVDPTPFIKAEQEAAAKANSTENQGTTTETTPTPTGILGVAVACRNIISAKDTALGNQIVPFHTAKIDKESIKNAITALINDLIKLKLIEPVRNTNLGGETETQQTATSDSFNIVYDKHFNIAESFMSSFGFNGANKLHVNRTIVAPKSKHTYYALSENAWGDGSKLDPEKYLKESLDNMLSKYSTFDEFAKLAKNSHSINFVKIAEDCSYNTAFPYNRYQMLTISNPLYEGLVIVRFDSAGKLVESIRTGVKKIYVETV